MVITLQDLLFELRRGAGDLLAFRVLLRARLPLDVDAVPPTVFVPDLHVLSTNRGAGYGDAHHLNRNRESLLG